MATSSSTYYPGIKSAPSTQSSTAQSSMSLTYSMDESFATMTNSNNNNPTPQATTRSDDSPGPAYELQRSNNNNNHNENNRNDHPNTGSGGGGGASFATSTEENSVDYSNYSAYSGYSGEESADHYFQYPHEQDGNGGGGGNGGGLATVNEYADASNPNNSSNGTHDATATVHNMHKQLLHLLSHPELFHESIDWQHKLDRGMDPTIPDNNAEDGGAGGAGAGEGIQAFDHEFEDEEHTNGSEEHKQHYNLTSSSIPQSPARSTATSNASSHQNNQQQQQPPSSPSSSSPKPNTTSAAAPPPARLQPPLPHMIFAPDAEVVLPQALTASQLFGLERFTGIELEAAAGLEGLGLLFLRWLALMPEGDHMNVINPPGLTVMRIAGGRYRVTGAHRVVWRWMNKFSPASTFQTPADAIPTNTSTANVNNSNSSTTENESTDTDFDFGDLVTMTIIDVFETDNDGKLLSYCPTFDNRAVHKTQESIERLRKGASQLREIARSPAGVKVNKAAGSFGKMSINAAMTVGNIVKHKIEEGIHKHQQQHKQKPDSDTSADAVGGEDVAEEEDMGGSHVDEANMAGERDDVNGGGKGLETEPSRDEQSASAPGSIKNPARGDNYFSDDSTAA